MVRKEVPMGFLSEDGRDLRPVDLLLFNWIQGKDMCLDVTGISPFAGIGANSWAPGVALHNAMEKKKRKYATKCADNGYKSIPFVFSTFRKFDKDALDTLSRISDDDFVSVRAVIDATHRKRIKYEAKCADIGYGFLPFSFSLLGELEKDAVTLLKRIRKFSVTQDIGAHVDVHILIGLVLL
ncbi:hypothetical protein Tco_0453000 [Tanacetum coccineum]